MNQRSVALARVCREQIAQVVESQDFNNLYGDRIADKMYDQGNLWMVEVFEEAKRAVVRAIRGTQPTKRKARKMKRSTDANIS